MELSNSTVKTPQAEAEAPTPTRVQLPASKPSHLNIGVLKRHAPLVVAYRECLKNHAAALGVHAVDGCGEFMPSPTSNPDDPTSLSCDACGCHRNFHRREPEDTPPLLLAAPPMPALEYRPHHRHHPPPPPNSGGSPDESPSPPPISSAYYRSAHHVLLALSRPTLPDSVDPLIPAMISPDTTPLSISGCRKRFRTKFTRIQKEKMLELADRVGWKMQRRDDELISRFCGEIGVDRVVFKVWMHNHKNNFGKKDHFINDRIAISSPPAIPAGNNEGHYRHRHDELEEYNDSKKNVHDHNSCARILGTNGSSSTS